MSSQTQLRVKTLLLLVLLCSAGLIWRSSTRTEAADANGYGAISRTLVLRTPSHLHDECGPLELSRRLSDAGVDEVWIQLKMDDTDEFVAGQLFYPSAVGPVAAGFESDQIGRLIDELTKAEIAVAAWVPTLHDAAAIEAHPEWQAWWIGFDGQFERQQGWLCPGNPEAIAYQTAIVGEIVRRYPQLSALYVDFIRYDSDYSCVCPRCLAELGRRGAGTAGPRRELTWRDVQAAGRQSSELWGQWIEMRAENISAAIESFAGVIAEYRQELWFGAALLPFSTTGYALNTQAGQDLYEISRSGVDEIVLMGYWDDWAKSPDWLRECLLAAPDLLQGKCELSCLLDGDMSVRRTRLTLEAIAGIQIDLGFFHYDEWEQEVIDRLWRALDEHVREGRMAPPEYTAVVIRVDTEPDYRGSYDAVSPDMLRTLMDMFEQEGIRGSFMTCGRLAELMPDVIREAVRRGHEIGAHGYDHEQLDALDEVAQLAVIEQTFGAFRALGIPIHGFAAPRNSITDTVRNRLIELDLIYDGSNSYDPLTSFTDASYQWDTESYEQRIVELPFIEPNDWDARRVAGVSAEQMLSEWIRRLDRVIAMEEPVFVLDTHQWLATEPENLDAVRRFIRLARANQRCRVTTLVQAARHVREYIDRFEPPAVTSGLPSPGESLNVPSGAGMGTR